jgi:Sigma-70 region 2
MQDREMVTAIAAGDPGGLAEAYDRYAASLYAYCRFMLPDPDLMGDAAGVVQDTFIIAAARAQGLRDPDQLGSWLHAIAQNEYLRRLGAGGGTGKVAGRPDPDGPVPEAALPAGLRERVLKACSDSTPTGRAYRASVTHRAGSFGRTGFPRPIIAPGPLWRHEVRRRPRAAAGVAAVAAAVVAAGIIAIVVTGGPHRTQASTLALGGGAPVVSAAPSSAASAAASSSPAHKAGNAKDTPTPSASPDVAKATQATAPGKPTPSATALSSSGSSPSPSPSASPSPSPSPSTGTLHALPTELALTAVTGKAANGTFLLGAEGGPVSHFVIKVPAGVAAKVTVSPSAGSLAGVGLVAVTVTVKSLTSLVTHLTVDPGGLVITVQLTIKA